jgi:hypothetical protein
MGSLSTGYNLSKKPRQSSTNIGSVESAEEEEGTEVGRG